MHSRRDILRAIALGGGLVAGELWTPGAKLISLPSPVKWRESFHGWIYLTEDASVQFSPGKKLIVLVPPDVTDPYIDAYSADDWANLRA